MALFEGYERRIDQINECLNKYGIKDIDEAKAICDKAGVDAYGIVKGIQPICFENACGAYTVGAALAIKNKAKEFSELTKTNEQNNKFNFYNKGLKNGDVVVFRADRSISAKVVGEREVEYLGQTYKLSPLTYRLYEEMGKLNKSGAYQVAAHFEYKGKLLKDLPNKV